MRSISHLRWVIFSAILTVAPSSFAQVKCPNQPTEQASHLATEATVVSKVDLEGGIRLMRQAADAAPEHAPFTYALGVFYRKNENWDLAVVAFERALRISPNVGLYLQALGVTLVDSAIVTHSQAQWEKASRVLSECIAIDADREACFHARATVALHLDNEQQALSDYSKSIALRPTVSSQYLPLISLYSRLDYLDQAEAVARLGLAFVCDSDNNKPAIWRSLASIKQARHDIPAMIDALEQAIQLAGDDSQLQFDLGVAYWFQGNKAKGGQLLKQFLARVCKDAKAEKYAFQCEQALALYQRLGGI